MVTGWWRHARRGRGRRCSSRTGRLAGAGVSTMFMSAMIFSCGHDPVAHLARQELVIVERAVDPYSVLLPRCPAQAGRAAVDRERDCAARNWCQSRSRAPASCSTGCGRKRSMPASRTADRPRAYPVAVRPADQSAQAAALVLRLRAPLQACTCQRRSGCSATSPSPCWSRTRSSRCSISRPTAGGKAVAAALDLVRQALAPITPDTNRRGAAPVRALSARALSTLRCGARREAPRYSSGSVVKNSG